MPIRITPIHQFSQCTLDLNSLRGIVERLERDFPASKYSARDVIWQIFDEPAESFLLEISNRKKLDSFEAQTDFHNSRRLTIHFDEEHSQITLDAPPDHEDWFQHFLIDIQKYIHQLSFAQLFLNFLGASLAYSSIAGFRASVTSPRSKIIIQARLKNPFTESIKANLVSNLIWVIIGAALILLAQWIFSRFGVDINPFD